MSARKSPAYSLALALGATLALAALLAPPAPGRAADRACGTVSGTGVNRSATWRVIVTSGSTTCQTARGIARKYGNPNSTGYNCASHAHVCFYAAYGNGWRCTGLFQGTFGCWLGGDTRGHGSRATFTGLLL